MDMYDQLSNEQPLFCADRLLFQVGRRLENSIEFPSCQYQSPDLSVLLGESEIIAYPSCMGIEFESLAGIPEATNDSYALK